MEGSNNFTEKRIGSGRQTINFGKLMKEKYLKNGDWILAEWRLYELKFEFKWYILVLIWIKNGWVDKMVNSGCETIPLLQTPIPSYTTPIPFYPLPSSWLPHTPIYKNYSIHFNHKPFYTLQKFIPLSKHKTEFIILLSLSTWKLPMFMSCSSCSSHIHP